MRAGETFAEQLTGVLDAQRDRLRSAHPHETLRIGSPAVDGAPAPRVQVDALEAFGDTLGKGGMGVVRTAVQRSLGRRVAVKSPVVENPPPNLVTRLLQEAWVGGALDHPNMVPVHDIVVDGDGLPHIVMKQVEGRPWTAWFRDATGVRDAFGARDLLEWNLRIFMAVCNAIAYAHERGVLHRDLKLDNVMIGRYGEVYVLDWGLAVAIDDRWGGRIPAAADETMICGTPQYMAPEMALGHGPTLGAHTDTYLLGGVLHVLLAGRPPHQGATIDAVLMGIPTLEVVLPGLPGELVRIVRKALAYEVGDRYPSAGALRDDVDEFLSLRGSMRISVVAQRAADAMKSAIAAHDVAAVRARFAEARFGFERSLEAWDDNPVAVSGLRDARLAMAGWELDQGEPGAAVALLQEVDDAPAALVARAEAAVADRDRAAAELARLRAEESRHTGMRTRVFVLSVCGGLWVVMPVLAGLLRPPLDWPLLFGGSIAMTIAVAGLGFWARDSLSKTRLNRLSIGTLVLVPVANLVENATVYAAGGAPETAFVLYPVAWFMIAAMYSMAIDARFWPVSVAYAVVSVVGAAVGPDAAVWGAAAANLLLVVSGLYAWRVDVVTRPPA